MSLVIPPHISAANADWDVEVELQRELDAVSISSHISSCSSSTGAEETFPADDPDRSNKPLHKLLEDWRIKERKLQSFEMMLSATESWKYDILDEISDQGQISWPGPADDPLSTYNEVQDLVDPIVRRGKPASNDAHSSLIDTMTLGETPTCSSSFSQHSCDLPLSSLGNSYDISEQAGRTTETHRPSQDHEMKFIIPNSPSQDFDKADVRNTRSYQDENNFPSCSMDYDEALSMLRKRRMRMLEEYRAAEAERLVGKNLKRQTETEESRKIFLLASRRQQELDNEIWKEKQDKIALLDFEQAKQIELFEELQRTEERDLQTKKLDMECRSTSLMDLVDTHKHLDEELELRRLEQETAIDLTADQENKHEQAVQTAPDDHCVKCCVLIQSWMRGFLCRRDYQDLKNRNTHALVSLLLPCESAITEEICGQEYLIREQHEDKGTLGLPEEPARFIHGQAYQQCGAQEDHVSITTSQEGIHGKIQSPEEILATLTSLAESGSMQDFKSCLDLATSYGMFAEASEVEAQLIQRKENVQSWLDQVVQGWDTTRSKIGAKIQEARRLEIYPLVTAAEAVMSAKEKEILDNLEASILKASRRNYTHWMRKAKSFGLEDTMETFSKSFQRTIKMVRNCLKREAKLGTKEKYVMFFKNAISLGLQSDVNLALKNLLKRVLQVYKRAILLACTSITDVDSREQDWNRVEMEGAEIGLDPQTLAELRETISRARSFESIQKIWVTNYKANDIGGSFTIVHGKHRSLGVEDLVDDASDSQLACNSREFSIVSGVSLHAISGGVVMPKELACNSREFSIVSGVSLNAISGGVVMPKSKTLWALPQNWLEMNRLRRDWQQHTLHLRTPGNDYSNYSQHGRCSTWERDCLPTRCARDKKRESTTNGTITKNTTETVDLEHRPVGCLNSDKDCREEEEGSSEFSESEEDLREVSQAQIKETPEHQRLIPRKSTLATDMLEEKLSCKRTELRWVMKLDLTDEHLKSLGRGQIFRWCPRLRFLTVDMNKLTTLRGGFEGGEDCLEQLSVKDNLLRDLVGLECLHKLNVLHLDGNLLSQLGFHLSNPILPNENGKTQRNGTVCVSSKNCGSLLSSLGRSVCDYCWPRLKVLTVGCNRLTKIFKIGNLCPNLELLDVGSNQIFSLGPTEDNCLAGLHHLRVLDVGQNRLQGRSLWKGLENCPELVSLVASRNKLRELPNHFGSVLLREIWLNGNAIKRLSCNAWLPSLQRLYLQDNMIDVLDSLWGCPALEVLDLSFNSISEVSHLRHLSCFPCLRTLQLNDNPVSEQEDHATYVLQAVPWLAELDNEAVTTASRDKAVTKIFKRTMDAVGLEFLKEKLSRGEVLMHGFSNPSGAQKCSFNNVELPESNTCQFLPQQEVNNLLNGDADEGSLMEMLSEAKRLASSSSMVQNLLAMNADMVKFEGLRNFSDSELEARSNMIAYRQMTSGLKGRVHAATKESFIARLLKEKNHSVPCDPYRDDLVEDSCRVVPLLNLSSESHLTCGKVAEPNLDLCLEEHTRFDSVLCTEIYSENKEYKLQAQTQIRRVTRLQALLRGYLARIGVRLLREQKTAMCQEQECKCACKIQAVWRGWKARRAKLLEFLQRAQFCAAVTIQAHWRGYSTKQRFRRALDIAKYMDDDDFEYVPIDESEFLAGEIAMSAVYQPSQTILSSLGKFSTSPSKTMITLVNENFQAVDVVQAEGINPVEHDTHDLHDVNALTCPFEVHTEGTNDTVPLAHNVEIDVSHVMDIIQGTFPTGTLSEEETECLVAPEDKICAAQLALQEKAVGLEILEESGRKEEIEESQDKYITDLLERIGIKSKLNMHVNHVVSEEEVSRIVKEHLGGISQSSEDPKNCIIPDARNTSSMLAADVKKRERVEELAKDWGFKSERTAQALLKARQKSQQQAKDAAHKNFLQDPEKRLKRFKEKVQGQASAPGAATRQFDRRASISFSGLTLQMPMDEQESCIIPEQELHKRDNNVRKLDGSSCPVPVPRLPHHRTENRWCTKSVENKKDMTKHHTKSSTRDLSAIRLSTVLLNTALQVSPFNDA